MKDPKKRDSYYNNNHSCHSCFHDSMMRLVHTFRHTLFLARLMTCESLSMHERSHLFLQNVAIRVSLLPTFFSYDSLGLDFHFHQGKEGKTLSWELGPLPFIVITDVAACRRSLLERITCCLGRVQPGVWMKLNLKKRYLQ